MEFYSCKTTEAKVSRAVYLALEQFHVSDERTAVEIEKALKALGREPVWKDWDASFDHVAQSQATAATAR